MATKIKTVIKQAEPLIIEITIDEKITNNEHQQRRLAEMAGVHARHAVYRHIEERYGMA